MDANSGCESESKEEKERKEATKAERNESSKNIVLIQGLEKVKKFSSQRQAAKLITQNTKVRPVNTSVTRNGDLWVEVASKNDAETIIKNQWPKSFGDVHARPGKRRPIRQERTQTRRQVFLSNIPLSYNETDINELFTDEGYTVQSVRCNYLHGRFSGKARVTFSKPEDRTTAIETKKFQDRWTGATIQVEDYYTEPKHEQCFRCFEFGHTKTRCNKTSKCERCSKEHDNKVCEEPKFCSNCQKKGHSPTAVECPSRQLQINLHHQAIQKLRHSKGSDTKYSQAPKGSPFKHQSPKQPKPIDEQRSWAKVVGKQNIETKLEKMQTMMMQKFAEINRRISQIENQFKHRAQDTTAERKNSNDPKRDEQKTKTFVTNQPAIQILKRNASNEEKENKPERCQTSANETAENETASVTDQEQSQNKNTEEQQTKRKPENSTRKSIKAMLQTSPRRQMQPQNPNKRTKPQTRTAGSKQRRSPVLTRNKTNKQNEGKS